MAYQGGKLPDGTPLNVAVYRAYRNAGLSHNQAMGITAEVGRENSFRSDVAFGNHTDPARDKNGNKIRNLGMLSWNQGRDVRLENFLNQKGVMRNGVMAKTQANLNAQAQFSVGEMKSKDYAGKLKNFWANPNASPESFARELGKGYIVWAYGQNDIKGKTAGTRVPFNWKAEDNRRRSYLPTLGNMLGDKNDYSQGSSEQQAPDPRLSMSAPQLLATLRKGKDKRSDLQILYELSNNNGVAGREIKQLMAQGESLNDIASQLGLKVPSSQPQAAQQAIEPPSFEQFAAENMQPTEPPSFEEFAASNAEPVEPPSFEDFSASYEQEQPQELVEPPSFEQFAASYEPTEQPTQAGDTWQTQNSASETTLQPKNERAQQPLKSSWESLS